MNKNENIDNFFLILLFLHSIRIQVSMPHRRGGISGASSDKKEEEEQQIAALAAITSAILQEVKESTAKSNQHKIVQIVIYESSV